MKTQQEKYIESVDGTAPHQAAIDIIGQLEQLVQAQTRLLVAYRVGGRPPEWVFETISKARKNGIKV